jgi:hypothetical protein
LAGQCSDSSMVAVRGGGGRGRLGGSGDVLIKDREVARRRHDGEWWWRSEEHDVSLVRLRMGGAGGGGGCGRVWRG